MVCFSRVAVRAGLWSLQRGILAPCLNNTGARLHKQHNGPGDRLQYHVVPVSNFNVTEPSYPSHSLAPGLFIPGRRIAKLELLSLDIFTQLL